MRSGARASCRVLSQAASVALGFVIVVNLGTAACVVLMDCSSVPDKSGWLAEYGTRCPRLVAFDCFDISSVKTMSRLRVSIVGYTAFSGVAGASSALVQCHV